MKEKIYYLSPKLHKWSDLEANDLFSRIHFPLNKIGKSCGFLIIYEKIDDAIDDAQEPEALVQIKINLDNIEKHYI